MNPIKYKCRSQEKKESFGSALGRNLYEIATGSAVSAKDYTNKNERRKNILSLIDATKEKSYYPQIMDLIVATNKSLNKEWTKNGKYFENKMEFYDAYLSDDYKQILKEKKKKK